VIAGARVVTEAGADRREAAVPPVSSAGWPLAVQHLFLFLLRLRELGQEAPAAVERQAEAASVARRELLP